MATLTKTKKGIQWAALIAAILVAVNESVDQGVIPPETAIYVLVATNILSALLPGIFRKA